MARSDKDMAAMMGEERTASGTGNGDEGLRPSGIDLIGGMKWGTHFCQFYDTPQDLLDILVPYFREGLAGNEFCMWVTSPPLGVDEAREALRTAVPDLDGRIRAGQMEILDYTQWYKVDGRFEEGRVLDGWVRKLEAARKRGFEGLRLTGNTFWLEAEDWNDFTQYEEAVNNVIGRYRMLAICTYSLNKCGAPEIMDVIANHQFAIVKRKGRWEVVESSERKRSEEALRASEAKLRGILNATGESIWMFDTDGVSLLANAIAMARIGKGAQDVIGKRMSDVISPDLARARMQRLREVVSSARPVEFEDERAGMHFHHSFYPVLDAAGVVTSVVSFSRDITARKRAEEALRESEERFRTITETSRTPVGVGSLDGTILYVNRAYEEVFGYSASEILGMKAPDLYWDPADRQKWVDALREGRPVQGIEVRMKRKDGTPFWVILSITPINYSGMEAVMGTFVDITERKRSEAALAETRSYLESLIEYANAPIIVWSPDLRITRFNRAFETLTGYGAGEVLGRRLEMLFPEESKAESLDKIAHTATGEHWESIEIPILRKDENVRIALWNSANIKDPEGMAIISTIAQGQDITERKKAEEALLQAKDDLDRAQAVAHTGSWRLDVRRNELSWSDENHRIFGVPKNTPMSYETFLGSVHPDDREYVDRMWNAGLRGAPYDIEHRILVDGQTRWVRETAELEFDRDGKLRGGFGTTQDITERKKAEVALRKALERNTQQEKLAAIGRLAGGVAHEIRNPLSAIKNAVYYLSMALDRPDGSVIETLALLNREIARSEDVISSLLGLAHPGRKVRSDVDVNQTLREVLRQRPPAGVEVASDLEETLPKLRADKAQLSIIFGNLIRNAYEAMPKGGCLRVTTRAGDGWVLVSIRDTGTGISREDLGRMFEPLMTTKAGGTGLGLPVAKTLVEGHGGSIEVDSEPGKGSTFTVKLPVKQRSRAGE
jgi:PAS domain S-box-containing protein